MNESSRIDGVLAGMIQDKLKRTGRIEESKDAGFESSPSLHEKTRQ
jgi:hypothetical protein